MYGWWFDLDIELCDNYHTDDDSDGDGEGESNAVALNLGGEDGSNVVAIDLVGEESISGVESDGYVEGWSSESEDRGGKCGNNKSDGDDNSFTM